MCGITGIINTGSLEILKKMTDIIQYRGPDDSGIQWFNNSNSGFGHRRLSIIDLSPRGHQPMSNEKGDLWITYNGEIYNYQEIRNDLVKHGYSFNSDSDTEVLLKAYEKWGVNCLEKLSGMFSFAIYNTHTNSLFAARDRAGIKPFYYHHNADKFIFASEIKAILATGLVDKKPDYYAMLTPTRFQIAPYTGFEQIFKLPAGHYLIFENGELEIQPYWQIKIIENSFVDEREIIERTDILLNEVVKQQMISDVPVGLFLSGGLDSSIIGALMHRNTNVNIHAFTIKVSDKDQQFEKMAPDHLYARQVAEKFGFLYNEIEISPEITDLLPKIIWHLEEPLADPAAINTYLISKVAREKGIIVLLNGMGGDEVFGGYRKHLACLKADIYIKYLPELIRSMITRIIDKIPVATSSQGLKYLRWLKRFLSFANQPQAKRFMSSNLSLTENEFTQIFSGDAVYEDTYFYKSQIDELNMLDVSYLNRMCLNDIKYFLTEHNLLYSDKTTMMASIEGRPPLTDHKIIEHMFSISPEFKIKGNQQKYLLKKVAERYLPREVIYREKAGFGVPLRAWIRGQLSEMVGDLLSEQSIRDRGLYNANNVSELIDRDRKGIEDNSYIIWWLLSNELWFRTFFN